MLNVWPIYLQNWVVLGGPNVGKSGIDTQNDGCLKAHLANGTFKKSLNGLFSLLNMESPKVQSRLAIG